MLVYGDQRESLDWRLQALEGRLGSTRLGATNNGLLNLLTQYIS